MICIICSHYAIHGGGIDNSQPVSQILLMLFRVGGQLGVTCFVLISAFFLSSSSFKFERIVRVFLECIFYSIILYIVGLFIVDDLSKGWLTYLYVIFAPFYNYWFVGTYIGMIVLSPLMNALLEKCYSDSEKGKKKLFFYICLLVVAVSVIQFIFVESNYPDFGRVVWFCVLYLVAGYIRRYNISVKKKWSIICFIGSIGLIWGSSVVIRLINSNMDSQFLINNMYLLSETLSPFMFVAGLSLFLVFKDINMKNRKVINVVASWTFACYLLHDNMLLNETFWKQWMHTEFFYDKPVWMMLLHMLACVAIIFVVTGIVEQIRQPLERLVMNRKWMKKICGKINSNLT